MVGPQLRVRHAAVRRMGMAPTVQSKLASVQPPLPTWFRGRTRPRRRRWKCRGVQAMTPRRSVCREPSTAVSRSARTPRPMADEVNRASASTTSRRSALLESGAARQRRRVNGCAARTPRSVRPSARRGARAFTEAGARHRNHAPVEQRVGDRGNKAHDSHSTQVKHVDTTVDDRVVEAFPSPRSAATVRKLPRRGNRNVASGCSSLGSPNQDGRVSG